MRLRIPLLAIAAVLLVGASPALAADAGAAKPSKRAVVIVSGGAAITPFTTPTRACKKGYPAGNTDDFLRSYFLKKGYRVFTSPAMVGRGKVVEQPTGDSGPFSDCPKALPGYMTVNAVGPIELAGTSLSFFIGHLNKRYGVKEIDIVAHSMGGLFSRSAIHYLQATGSPVKVRSFNTIGTPWMGNMFANSPDPADPKAACDGFELCIGLLDTFGPVAPDILTETKTAYMEKLNNDNAGVLRRIPVTLVAGNHFQKPGGISRVWPNDGTVAVESAFATTLSDQVINHRRCYMLEGGVHHIYTAEKAGLPEDTAITWNSKVADWVLDAIRRSPKALKEPNRVGCPPAG